MRLAEREYRYAREALERIDAVGFPEAEAALAQAQAEYAAGTISLEDLRDELEEASLVARARREALVRFRRAMLDLNTAVGMRILP